MAMPADPLSKVQEGAVAIVVMYRTLRAAGMPVLAAACYLAAVGRLSGDDPDAEQGGM
jgi:hypothetical protein